MSSDLEAEIEAAMTALSTRTELPALADLSRAEPETSVAPAENTDALPDLDDLPDLADMPDLADLPELADLPDLAKTG